MKSVNSQFEDWQLDYYTMGGPDASRDGKAPENITEDVAVIITSSWIPSHPSTYMVEMVVNSTEEQLIGLAPTAPIFITIDHFRFTDFANLPPILKERIDKLDDYTTNLMNLYLTNPRIHIIPSPKNMHIGGSVMKAMNLIERHYPTVRYVYSLQHDFHFFKKVDHTALVGVMDRYPDKINWVRFPKRNPRTISRNCGEEKAIIYNRTIIDVAFNATASDGGGELSNAKTLVLSPTSAYSDNNHFARFKWYKETIASLVFLTRPPEDPLQVRANNGCRGGKPMGLYLYHEMNILHLDGRNTKA